MQFLIDIGLSIVYFCAFLLICAWSWRFWMMYIQQKHLLSLNWILLEIKLPREITKSPLATETALAALLQSGGVSTKHARNFEGKLPAYFSLEIASLEGVVHFYIRTQKKFRPIIEANFYAQYPEIEIVEVEDYTSRIRYDHLSKDVSLWGLNFKPSKSWQPTNPKTGKPYDNSKKKGKKYTMPADFLPIKTYVDYGLDKDPKEEFKVDPLVPLLELMGSIRKGEYLWYQILVQDEGLYDGTKMPKLYVNAETHEHVSLREMAETRKKQIRTSYYIENGDIVYDDYGRPKQMKSGTKDAEGNDVLIDQTYALVDPKDPEKKIKAVGKKEMDLTIEEKEEIEGINKKFSKSLAVCVMRLVYVARQENFNGSVIPATISITKPFSGTNTPIISGPTDPYDYPWERLGGKRTPWRGEEKFEAYVEREGFFPHVDERTSLDKWEDLFFWSSTMRSRRIFRMIYEAIFYPFDHPTNGEAFTLNLEELATLWHLPGAVASVPTLPRIDSTKGAAPANLPL